MARAANDLTNNRTGWRMVVVVFFVMALVYSIWYSFAVFLVALTQEFGWGRGEAALGFSIFTLFGAAFSPVLGLLLDRYGARTIMVSGAVLTAVGLAACSQIQELWQFYLFFGVLVAIGSSACGWMACVAVIQSWFSRNFSTANGLANSGIGIGIFILVPGIQLLNSNLGWRSTYLLMAAVAILVIAPLCLLLYRRPREDAPVVTAGVPKPPPAASWTMHRALRSPALWFLFGMALLLNFSNQQPLVHQIAYLTDQGVQVVLAATIAGAIGLVSVFAKPGWGYAADKIGREVSVTIGGIFVIASLAALWWLPGRGAPELLFLYAFLMGIGYSISNPLPPAMTADLFPGRHFGVIFGIVVMGTFGGSAVGAWLAGFLFDQTDSYLVPFILATIGTILAIICAWLAAPRRARAAAARLAAAQAAASPGTERLLQAPPSRPDQRPESPTAAIRATAANPVVAGVRPMSTRAEEPGLTKVGGPPGSTGRTASDLLAAEVIAGRDLTAWAARTPDGELAEGLEVAAARARDRAFQLRRAGVAMPAGTQPVPVQTPESSDDVARLERWLERPALYGEGSAAASDPALHAIWPALQSSEAETWSLLAEQRERLTAEPRTAAIQVLPAAPRFTADGVWWQTIANGEQSLPVTRISQRPGATVRLRSGRPVSLLPLSGAGTCRPAVAEALSEALSLRGGCLIDIAADSPVEIATTGDWPLTYLILGDAGLAPVPVAAASAATG